MWQKLILSNNYWHDTSSVTKCGNDSMALKCSHSLNMENVIPCDKYFGTCNTTAIS